MFGYSKYIVSLDLNKLENKHGQSTCRLYIQKQENLEQMEQNKKLKIMNEVEQIVCTATVQYYVHVV